MGGLRDTIIRYCQIEVRYHNIVWSGSELLLCLLFIHPRAPNLINLRSAGTMPA